MIDRAREIFRVLKPGGVSVDAVPFRQAEDNRPYDYCRFACDGIHELVKYAGFERLPGEEMQRGLPRLCPEDPIGFEQSR